MEPRSKRRRLTTSAYHQTYRQPTNFFNKIYSPILPLEIISKIYSYLSPHDVDCASKTCHQWLYAKQLNRNNYLKLHLNGSLMKSPQFLLNYIVKSERIVSKVTLENFGENKISKNFWKNLNTVELTELKIQNCSITIYELVEILKCLPKLKKIEFKECQMIFQQLSRKRSNFKKAFFDCFKNLQSFKIDLTWTAMNDCDFKEMLSRMEDLKEFDIYLDLMDPVYIVDNIKKWNLTSLKLVGNISALFEVKFFQEIKHLNLTVFKFGSSNNDLFISKIPFNMIQNFLLMQTNLRKLSIGFYDLSAEKLLVLMQIVNKLEYLKILNSCFFMIIDTELVTHLNRLKGLDICLQGRHYMNSFFFSTNDSLTHFTFKDQHSYYRVTEDTPMQIPLHRLTQFNSLTHFDLNHKYICGIDIQFIIKNLKNLEVLRIHTENQLSDFAYTGTGQPLPKTMLDSFCDYHRDMFQNSVYSSIASLTKLVVLDIKTPAYKNDITDKSLYQISQLKNLRKLNLSNYKKITLNGICRLIKNCLYLEQINITGCTEDVVKNIVSYLPPHRFIQIINS